jgi:Ca2+-binding RTX toxin-like protein
MATTQWIGGSGSWDDPANWSNGVPGTADTAVFANSGSETVSGSGSVGTLDVAGDLVTLTGDITAGTVSVNGGAFTIDAGATLIDAGNLEVTGTASLWIYGTVEDSSADIGPGGSVLQPRVFDAGGNWITTGTIESSAILSESNGATIVADQLDASFFGADTSSTIEAPINAPHGLLFEIDAAAVPGALNTLVISDPITLGGNSQILGSTLDLLGPIAGTGSLGIVNGNVILSGANASFSGSVRVSDSGLVLNAPAAIGTGPILLTDAELAIEAGASGQPNGSTTVVQLDNADQNRPCIVSAVNTPVLAYGQLTFEPGLQGEDLVLYNGSAASTVYGGIGSAMVFAGSGGGQFFGGTGGNNLIVGGSGAATIGGGGNGDQLWANGSAGDLIAAASGNETLGAGNSTGNNLFFGGTGNDLIMAGAGNDLVVAGSGTPTIFGGSGNTAIFAGSGQDLIVLGSGADYVQMGTGNAAIFAGTGADLFGIYNGQAGGNDIISGFKNGTDHIALRGYPSAPSIVSHGGNTTITLSDNTQVTLLGVRSLNPNTFL